MKIVALTDYKGRFGSKHFDVPYRSGMDKDLLEKYFKNYNVDIEFVQFSDIANNLSRFSKNDYYIYTSSEDIGYKYKSYIEDIVFYLEISGFKIIPKYKYLRANNNKVFMELLRDQISEESPLYMASKVFGVKEELDSILDSVIYPIVVKNAEGACGVGVFKADAKKELVRVIKKMTKTPGLYNNIKDLIRSYIHKGYLRESKYRNKFIIQQQIEGLSNDYKILCYREKCFVLYRGNRDNDFRASGSGKFLFRDDLPEGILEYAYSIQNYFDVPNISLDIAYDGKRFYLLEFQFLYFGTTTLEKSHHYFHRINSEWQLKRDKLELEEVYVKSIVDYICNNCK